VFIDPRNSGEWESCVTVPKLSLPTGWVPRSYLGLTATTGQLADNHDILYLKTSSDAAKIDEEEAKQPFQLEESMSVEAKFERLTDVVNKLIDAHETLDHHVEHQLASVVDHIKNLLSKLEKREDTSENRLQNLENMVKKVRIVLPGYSRDISRHYLILFLIILDVIGSRRISRSSIISIGDANERHCRAQDEQHRICVRSQSQSHRIKDK
jgi:hypothetical protein